MQAWVRQRCLGCVVQADCLASALVHGDHDGMWGGTTPADRRRLRKALRATGVLGLRGEARHLVWDEAAAGIDDDLLDAGAIVEPLAGASRATDTPAAPPHPSTGRPLTPWPHQRDAIDAVVTALGDGGSAQITMATATGKTLVALWAAAELGGHRVLVLLPSLSLVDQTARVWAAHWPRPATLLAVCTQGAVRDVATTTDPADVLAAFTLAGPTATPVVSRPRRSGATKTSTRPGAATQLVVTASDSVALVGTAGLPRRRVGVEEPAAGPAGRDLLCFATYLSAASVLTDPALTAAGEWDIAVADEAHHLAGATDKAFAAIVRGEIPAARRLYQTATPRTNVRSRGGIEVTSMDDPVFGPRVYKLGLSDAIARGLVADYRVVVASVDGDVFNRVAAALGPEVDPHLLAGAIAVVRTMSRQQLRSCLSFHSRVERASSFAVLTGRVAELLDVDERPEGQGFAAWVDGTTPAPMRARLLERLASPNGWGVLANARCVGEGVDVPTLDAVAIVDPKNSEVDVAQAVGRALRLPGGVAKTGVVILPVLIHGEVDPSDPLAGVDQHSLNVVIGALTALRSQDAQMASRFDVVRHDIGRLTVNPTFAARSRRRAAAALLACRIDLDLPGGATGALAEHMALSLVRESTQDWAYRLGQLTAWADATGTAAIPQLTVVWDGLGAVSSGAPGEHPALDNAAAGEPVRGTPGTYGLGAWASTQRQLHAKNLLADDRVAALEVLPGWTWTPRADGWWAIHASLVAWAGREGSASPPQGTVVDGHRLGQFVNTCRLAYKAGSLPAEKADALVAIPKWSWDARADTWEEHFAQLSKFVAIHGHASPSRGTVIDGFDISRWVIKQRAKQRQGTQPGDRLSKLTGLPGWVVNDLDAAWEVGYAHLVEWMASHATTPFQTDCTEDRYRLGSWVAKQRARRTSMDPARARRLEQVPRWDWDPRTTTNAWGTGLAALTSWVAEHGTTCLPHKTPHAGIDLGSWVYTQRTLYSKQQLSAERIADLEAVPEWYWTASEAKFYAGLAGMATYLAREHTTRVAANHIENGVALRAWVAVTRRAYATGTLLPERRAAVDALPGWTWAPLSDGHWEFHASLLARFAERTGHCSPGAGDAVDGVLLAPWVQAQRGAIARGRLGTARRARLRALPGWVDTLPPIRTRSGRARPGARTGARAAAGGRRTTAPAAQGGAATPRPPRRPSP